jgi:hypothetical protein
VTAVGIHAVDVPLKGATVTGTELNCTGALNVLNLHCVITAVVTVALC